MAKSGGSTELTPKQETFIAALMAGHTLQTAALAAKIGERTAQRWHTLPHIRSALKAAQKQVFDQAIAKLAAKAEKAVDTIDDAMSNAEYPTRVTAAKFVFEQLMTSLKHEEIEERLAELEERLPAYE